MKKISTMPSRGYDQTAEQAEVSLGFRVMRVVFRTAFILTIGIITLVGLWAVLALVSGLIGAGGPVAMVKSWFDAVGF